MDPYYYRSSAAAAAAASSAYGGFSSSSYRLQPQYSQPRDSFALDRWSSLPSSDLSPFSAYPRSSLDPRLDRVASFPREALPTRAYAPPLRRRVGNVRPAKKSVPAQSLGPKKKAFKQTQGGKAVQKPVTSGKKETAAEAKAGKDTSNSSAMAKEIKELHSLWRTGVDLNPAKKQKIEEEEKDGAKAKKEGGKEDLKKSKRKRKRGQQRKKWIKKDTEERSGKLDAKKQAIVDLQQAAGKSAREFFGISPNVEAANNEAPPEDEAPPEAAVEGEGEQKVEEKIEELTPEEAKAKEDKAVEYFSKMLEENQELRKLYVENCNDGTFECVVCNAIGVKFVKRFRNLVSLVMHASKTLKPKNLPEHRGYGNAVCTILGWDPLKLPPIPRGKGRRPRGATADGANAEDSEQGEGATDTKVENGDGSEVPDKDTEEVPEEIEADEGDEKTEVVLTVDA